MSVTGDDSVGWTWSVRIDDVDLYRTAPLARDDLASALFSIQRDKSRINPHLNGLSNAELFLVLDGFFFGSLHEALRASAEEQTWAKHLVSPALPTVVHSRLYLIGSGEGQERLLEGRGGEMRAYSIVEGEFDRQLAVVRSRLNVGEGV